MKRLLAVLIALSLFGCSMNKVTDPVLVKGGAQGTPGQEGGGGEEGGGGGGQTISLGDSYNVELGDEVNVPVHINGALTNGKGYQATVTVSSGVTVITGSAGPFLTDNDPNSFGITSHNSDGSYTLVYTLGPNHCSSASFGTVFYLRCRFDDEGEKHVTLVGSPVGSVTPSPYARDCDYISQPITYGNTNTTINVVNP